MAGIGASLLVGGRSVAPAAAADETTERHGLSYFDDLKYPPDFPHFSYVDPQAPKGGKLLTIPQSWSLNQSPQTFDTLNTLVLKGRAAAGLTMIYDSLMVRAFDEPDALYGLVARSVRILDSRTRYVFTLRPEARFHDGSPLTADDVAFSLTTLKEKGHPQISEAIRGMVSAVAEAPDRVVVTFAPGTSRGLPLLVAGLPIISRAAFAGRDFEQTTLDRPLGSGPYKVGAFEVGRFIEYDRVADYWGRDLPVQRGKHNFETIRYDFFRDRTVSFEGFKGGQYLLREENTALVAGASELLREAV